MDSDSTTSGDGDSWAGWLVLLALVLVVPVIGHGANADGSWPSSTEQILLNIRDSVLQLGHQLWEIVSQARR